MLFKLLSALHKLPQTILKCMEVCGGSSFSNQEPAKIYHKIWLVIQFMPIPSGNPELTWDFSNELNYGKSLDGKVFS